MNIGKKINRALFLFCIAAVLIFFFWSRLDFSHRIYYFGDGNVVVEIIRLMLSSHDWDPNWMRLKGVITQQPEQQIMNPIPEEMGTFYNLAGYTMIATAISKVFYSLGFTDWPIPSILRGLNCLTQIATLLLLYLTGKKLLDRYTGLLAAALFVVFPLVTMEAHYERPETWLCFLLTAVSGCCVYFHESPRRYSALIGALIGLSIATKVNQVFLLVMPGILLVHLWLTSTTENFSQKAKTFFLCGSIVSLCTLLAVFINTPFLLTHLTDTINGLVSQSVFYSTEHYPYSEEHYSFIGQLIIAFRYYWVTLGAIWCLFLLAGLISLIREFLQNPASNKIINPVIIAPILILFIFSSLLTVFVERTLSSIEGVLCLVTAIGFVYCTHKLHIIASTKKIASIITAIVLLAMLYTPLHIDYVFIDRYIKHPDKPRRVVFQETLKKDFGKFWIKNVYFSYKVLMQLPEKPEKAPRIYQIDDLNERWTTAYLALLEQNGFRKIGVYCSEFSGQPPNTLTIYHAAAKNHYFVRNDEWPADVSRDYFKTNCPP